jgi:hypothetical protein
MPANHPVRILTQGALNFIGSTAGKVLPTALVAAGGTYGYFLLSAQGSFNIGITLTSDSQVAKGLVDWWTFDGPNMINNVTDSSGNGNNAYLVGYTSTTTVPGVMGQALPFNGTSNYASTTNNANVTASTPFSLSAWIDMASTSANRAIISNANSQAPYDGAYLEYYQQGCSPGALFFGLADSADAFLGICSIPTVAQNTWYLVTGTYDGSNTANGMSLYINGSQVSTTVPYNSVYPYPGSTGSLNVLVRRLALR